MSNTGAAKQAGGDVELAVNSKEVNLKVDNGNQEQQLVSQAYVTWKDLQVHVSKGRNAGKTLLRGVSGFVEPCKLLALMGPTGSGKTTLLDTLAGRLAGNAKHIGTIKLNGKKSNLSYGRTAYVTQDDILMGTLTVRETVAFSAFIRLPPSYSKQQKLHLVDNTIRELGLETAANTYLGNWHIRGCSGGQRQRVKVAQELVVQPSLMFLDEPTTGLDAAAAYYFGVLMRSVCSAGRTILMSIHQPSSELFEQFHDLCLLAEGKVIYFGAADNAGDMFSTVGFPAPKGRSISDHLLHCVNRDFQESTVIAEEDKVDIDFQIETLSSYYSKTFEKGVLDKIDNLDNINANFRPNVNLVNPVIQLGILIKRNFQNMIRNLGVYWIRLVMYVVLCICIGTIFINLDESWQDVFSRVGVMYYIVCFLTFMSVAGFPAFVEEMKVFLRERLNGYYGVGVFAIANTVTSTPFLFLIAVLCSVMVYWTMGLNDEGDRFPYFVLNLWLSLLVVESLMMAISAIVTHFLMGIVLGAGLLGLFMLVSGFFKTASELPDPVWRYPMHYLAYHTYAFFGFMNNEFRDTEGWGCPCSVEAYGCAIDNCSLTGSQVLSAWEIPNRDKYIEIGVLIGMVLVYRLIFYGMLKLREAISK